MQVAVKTYAFTDPGHRFVDAGQQDLRKGLVGRYQLGGQNVSLEYGIHRSVAELLAIELGPILELTNPAHGMYPRHQPSNLL